MSTAMTNRECLTGLQKKRHLTQPKLHRHIILFSAATAPFLAAAHEPAENLASYSTLSPGARSECVLEPENAPSRVRDILPLLLFTLAPQQSTGSSS